MSGESGDLWVFGYGSLMWRPGFAFLERHVARIHGYHRSLCVFSHVHRGTPERPGLVLGLDRGGSCLGMAFRVAAGRAPETLAYLREREQVTGVYAERSLTVALDSAGPEHDGVAKLLRASRPRALVYVVDRRHPQYAGRLDHDTLLGFVRQGAGRSGANPDYVRNTHAHLDELGVHDPTLAWLVARL